MSRRQQRVRPPPSRGSQRERLSDSGHRYLLSSHPPDLRTMRESAQPARPARSNQSPRPHGCRAARLRSGEVRRPAQPRKPKKPPSDCPGRCGKIHSGGPRATERVTGPARAARELIRRTEVTPAVALSYVVWPTLELDAVSSMERPRQLRERRAAL